jgi:hypothetical protein
MPRLRSVVARLLTQEEWDRYFETPAPSKMQTLVDLIHRAKGESQKLSE